MPTVSVVVPVRNGAESLPRLLRSLQAQGLDSDAYEVIVVDNASSDQTAEVARSFGVRVVHEPIANRSRARNAGVRVSTADLIAFTDADCEATAGWLAALVACRGQAPLIAGRVDITTGTPPNPVERFESLWRFDQRAWVDQGWAATANLMVERSVFNAVGGLDTTYRHIGEDADFCLRAGRAGFGLGYCDEAVIRHQAESEILPTLRRAFFHGYSAAEALERLGVGHAARHHLSPLISPYAALRWHRIDPGWIGRRQRVPIVLLAWLTYASRVAGSLWAALRGVG